MEAFHGVETSTAHPVTSLLPTHALPSSQNSLPAESVIAKNAFDRISEMCAQLGLRNSIVEIGHQVCVRTSQGAAGLRPLCAAAAAAANSLRR